MSGRGLASSLGRVRASAVSGLRDLGAVAWDEMRVYATALEAFEPVEPAPEAASIAVERVADARALPDEATGAEPTDLVATASADGAVVGWAFARVDPPVRVGECVRPLVFEGAYLWGLFVEPGARGRGVGAALVSALTDAVARDRYRWAFALVEGSNAESRRVFERVGYECVDETVRVAVGGRRPPTGFVFGSRTYANPDS
jgi:GNAT superfamily N-acetyltransferase